MKGVHVKTSLKFVLALLMAAAFAFEGLAAARRAAPYVGCIVMDADTGDVLLRDKSEALAYPASVTKLMTFLLILEDMREGLYAPTDTMVATVRATREEPSIVGIKPGESMTVNDLLISIMVKSANDAAVVLAENSSAIRAGRKGNITGADLPAFIARMNERAAALGMSHTRYASPNGLPPPKSNMKRGFDESTAADLAKLARLLVAMPETFKYTSLKMATVTDGAGNPLRMVNHNNILVKDKLKILDTDGRSMVDGLKTGYIDAGGSSIILTGTRNGRRAIVIVLGSDKAAMRDAEARRLMVDALGAFGG